MKTTLTTIALASILLSAGIASADETTSARPAAARSAARAQRSQAARAARTARAEAAAPVSAASTSLIRGFGSCDAASFEELAAEVGRLAAMEDCTARGNPNAAARELSRTAPRQTDLGIPEEAFDAGFEVSGL